MDIKNGNFGSIQEIRAQSLSITAVKNGTLDTIQEIRDESPDIYRYPTEEIWFGEDWLLNLKLMILKMIITIYGIITLPIYILVQRPWKVWQVKRITWAKHTEEGNPFSPVRKIMRDNEISMDGISTLDELFRTTVTKYGSKKCFGVRRVLEEREMRDKAGKTFKKQRLGDYHWSSYDDAEKSVDALSKGLLALGLKSKQKIAVFAETRREWFLIFQACLRINVVVATLYTTLTEDDLVHAINETEVSTIVTSQELLPKLKKMVDKILAINNIIYMENAKPVAINGFPSHVLIFQLSEIERMGKSCKSELKNEPPISNDLAIIMYTSGSTGPPKGVLITHKNMLARLISAKNTVKWSETDVYIAYLPLAHVYEMSVELFAFHNGIQIGYSSALTLMDNSIGLIAGCKCDITILQPTVFCTVPVILNRIRNDVNEIIARKGHFERKFHKYAIQYKSFWSKWGFDTTIINRLVLREVQQILGGRIKQIWCGSAHLSLDTHIFINNYWPNLIQVYGTTETSGDGTCMPDEDCTIGRIGAPYFKTDVKLVDWDEGGYKVTDKPHPRGEIVIGGETVTLGYFKNAELTNLYFKDENGVRWFYTGDIGKLFPDGTFKIIDRKKNLHKLPHGEYVSLGKLEAEMKAFPYVDNICVIASIDCDYLVALVVPNEHQLKMLATKLNKENLTLRQLCEDRNITESIIDILRNHGRKNGILNREIPQKIKLCFEEWSPETGLVTASLKIKRRALEQFYQDAVNEMQAKGGSFN